MPLTWHTVHSTDGCRLQAYTLGDVQRPALVLVHGYPDNHRVWLPVAELLAAAFYVVMYDVRGAGASERPRRIRDYTLAQLSRDLNAVVDAVIPGRPFHLAGHDWGSIQSWESVTTPAMQGRLLSFTSISGPCLDHVGHWMRRRLRSQTPGLRRQAQSQLLSSWYILLFQLPVVAPTLWRTGLGRAWPKLLSRLEGIAAEADNPTQTDDGRWGVQLYRANFLPKLLRPQQRPAHCPVQLVIPTQDRYVRTGLFDDIDTWVPQLTRHTLDAGHWVLLAQPKRIATFIQTFIQSPA